jgi:molybdopterin converting factor small subunit
LIRVTCFGHIRTSLGTETLEVDEDRITTIGLIEKLREMGRGDPNLGFNRYNTLVIVNGSSAFTGVSKDRLLVDGDEVVLLPFSHGG